MEENLKIEEKACRHCGTMIPETASVCFQCRRRQGMSPALKVIISIVFLCVIWFLWRDFNLYLSGGGPNRQIERNNVLGHDKTSETAAMTTPLPNRQDGLPHALEGGNGSTSPILVYSHPKLRAYIPEGVIKLNIAYSYPEDVKTFWAPLYIEFKDNGTKQQVVESLDKDIMNGTIRVVNSGKSELLKYVVDDIFFDMTNAHAVYPGDLY